MSKLNGPQQLDAIVKLALEAGHRRDADMVAKLRADRYPIRDWEYGACIWCEVIDGKRRKATMLDLGGGPPVCDKHADPVNFPDAQPLPDSYTEESSDAG